jgi:hypothetical protein
MMPIITDIASPAPGQFTPDQEELAATDISDFTS